MRRVHAEAVETRIAHSSRKGVAIAPPRSGVGTIDAVQRDSTGAPTGPAVHAAARLGIRGPGGRLPFFDRLQRSFGDHDLRGVVSHTGPEATAGAQAMGARAFATGRHVAFAGRPNLHTVAHEAAHVIQQRSGVQLKGGVGQAGDAYERQADDIADRVVRGEAVGALLGTPGGALRAEGPVQRVVNTDGGAWNTTTYTAWGPARPDFFSDYGLGAEIAITFNPAGTAPYGDKIGLIQTVTATAGGAADPTGSEVVGLNAASTAIDRGQEDGPRVTSPVYGAHNTATSTATKLKHNAPASGGNHWGIRNRVFANTPATLWDKPSSRVDHDGAISKTFETAAVVLTGTHKGKYLGSVTWGYTRGAGVKGAPQLVPFAKVSDGDPSAQFLQAAADWNAASTALRPLVAVPIPG